MEHINLQINYLAIFKRSLVQSCNYHNISKWTEVIPLKEIKFSGMAMFIKQHIIYQFLGINMDNLL